MNRLRILIIAPDPLARAGLATIFEHQDGCAVVGQAADLADLNSALDLYRPDVGLVDLGINFVLRPGVFDQDVSLPLVYLVPIGAASGPRNGELLNRGHRDGGPSSAGRRNGEPSSAGRRNGDSYRPGRAILARDADPGVIVHAFHAVVDGLLVQDPKIESRSLSVSQPMEGGGRTPSAPTGSSGRTESALSATPASPIYEPLTRRELEVLGLIAEGLPNKRVAQRLGISEHTVKYHINTILGKLGAESRTEAVTRAARLGWLIL